MQGSAVGFCLSDSLSLSFWLFTSDSVWGTRVVVIFNPFFSKEKLGNNNNNNNDNNNYNANNNEANSGWVILVGERERESLVKTKMCATEFLGPTNSLSVLAYKNEIKSFSIHSYLRQGLL